MKPLHAIPAILAFLILTAAVACASDTPQPTPNQPQPTSALAATPAPQSTPVTQETDRPTAASATPATPINPRQTPTGSNPPRTPPPEPTKASSAPPATPEPAAETGGICPRNPAVTAAILEALETSSCATVTDDHLASIKSLTITAQRVDAEDVAGLSTITDLELQLTSGVQAHLASLTTLKNATITLTLPPPPTTKPYFPSDEEVALHTIPVDFLPHFYGKTSPRDNLRYDDSSITVPPDAGFETINYFITGGRTPKLWPIESMAHQLLQQRYQTTNLTITDRSLEAIKILAREPSHPPSIPTQPLDHPTGGTVQNLTLIITGNPDGSSLNAKPHFLSGTIRVPNLKIINASETNTMNFPKDFLTTTYGSRPYHVEIRGKIKVNQQAFDARDIASLHLDPRPSGDDHQLAKPWYDHSRIPEGSGWYYEE